VEGENETLYVPASFSLTFSVNFIPCLLYSSSSSTTFGTIPSLTQSIHADFKFVENGITSISKLQLHFHTI